MPVLLLGGLAIIAFEKGDAAKEVSTSWKPVGLKVRKLNGTRLECEVPVEFTNTNRQSVGFQSLQMNVLYEDESIGYVNVNTPVQIPTGQHIIKFPVTLDLFTLLRKTVDFKKLSNLLATLNGVSDWATWFSKNLGLRNVVYKGHIIFGGVQKSFELVQDLGNVQRAAVQTAPLPSKTVQVKTGAV